jgi:hypothetical protein
MIELTVLSTLLAVLIGPVLVLIHFLCLIGIFIRLGRLGGKPPGWSSRTCPHCCETIKYKATVCRFCTRDVRPEVTLTEIRRMK